MQDKKGFWTRAWYKAQKKKSEVNKQKSRVLDLAVAFELARNACEKSYISKGPLAHATVEKRHAMEMAQKQFHAATRRLICLKNTRPEGR